MCLKINFISECYNTSTPESAISEFISAESDQGSYRPEGEVLIN